MDRLEAMTVLVAVVEGGSLSAGARRLGMPLPTVSRKVAELEAHLGTRLLDRSSRRITETDAGRSYVLACRRILDDLAEAEREASGEYMAPKGELVVSAPVVFGRIHALPIVVAFLQAYPDIDIRLALADRVVDIAEEHVDLALRIAALPDSSLVARRVGDLRRLTCASPAYLERRGRPERPADLAAHDCITFAGSAQSSAWTFGDERVLVRSRLLVNAAEPAVEAAVAGLGITRVLSYQAHHALRDGSLEIVLEGFEPPPLPVHLVHRGGRLLPLKLRAFIDFAAPRLKAGLADLVASSA
ncbi:MAG TPA: LysR family transcriptional regulator [Geminicoccus sp.]|jgi:DNA-binding transcriptional LysR family regulator|uniref:LysR family transcriptional regulator n=1 Tax=Geminicoccus sp. TaxID=2024832 RepID=UPI002E2F8732|nr:LysR family transcriptional regulator [Geminicoccus sp.]HEX2529459.1 LysR family transcriptional regulator [Geminicoccus sp.]